MKIVSQSKKILEYKMITVIISYYKALDNLKLILKALNNQSQKDFEVIISEDDINNETIEFVKKNKTKYAFPIQHVHQIEDNGFRKNMMLNKSIKASKYETLVFIDGDCIPHKHFVKAYIKNSESGYILWGRRVMLEKRITAKLLKTKSLKLLNFISLLFSNSEKIKDGIYSPLISLTFKEKGLKGCNWGIKKEHLIAVNGFDEDYIRAAVGEDDDIEWRLKENGLKKKSLKNKAIVYHLYHPRSYANKDVEINNNLLNAKKKLYHIKCLNGINKLH